MMEWLLSINILRNKAAYQRDPQLIAEAFSPDETAVAYHKLFTDLQHGRYDSSAPEPAAYERLRAMRDEASG